MLRHIFQQHRTQCEKMGVKGKDLGKPFFHPPAHLPTCIEPELWGIVSGWSGSAGVEISGKKREGVWKGRKQEGT